MKSTKKIALSGLFLCLGLLLPFLSAHIQLIGNMILPMHYPVFLCGLICGWPYGLAIGIIVPLLRSALFSMPVFFPNALSMAAELAVYGALSGWLFSRKRSMANLYASLILSGLCGRIVWGAVMYALLGLHHGAFTWPMFLAGAFGNALPGIILQLILIPACMYLLSRHRLIEPIQSSKLFGSASGENAR